MPARVYRVFLDTVYMMCSVHMGYAGLEMTGCWMAKTAGGAYGDCAW